MAKKPAKWEEDLEKEATADAAREKARTGGTGNKVSIKNRRFTFGGENMGRELVGVIVDFAYLRTWFATKFDPDKPGVPQCWALSEDGEDMAPPDTVEDQQSTACEGCPMNEWESGKGKAKACGDRRRLGFLHEDDIKTAEDVDEAIAAMIEIPPTSTGTWATYLKELKTKHKRPIYSVLTKLSFDPEVSYAKVVFEFEESIDDEDVVLAIKERRDGVREMLMEPFDSNGGSEKPKKKKKVVDEDEDDEPPRKKKRVADEDDEDEEVPRKRRAAKDDDEDEDDVPRKKSRSARDEDDEDGEPTPKKRRSRDASDDDEDEESRRKRGGSRKATRDDDDEDKPTRKRKSTADEDDDDDEEDEAPVKRRKKVVEEDEDDEPPKRKKKVVDDDDDGDDEPAPRRRKKVDDDEDEDETPSRKRRAAKDDEDDEDEEDEPKRKKRGSRFSK